MVGAVRGWRIFYADGSTFDSADGAWAEAPSEGVQIVVIFEEPPYRRMETGLEEYAFPEIGLAEPKRGSLMDEAAYYALQRRALADMDWPGA